MIVLNLAAILLEDGTPNNNPSFIKTQQRTVLHELTHAMVFHPELFMYYRDRWLNFRANIGNGWGYQTIWTGELMEDGVLKNENIFEDNPLDLKYLTANLTNVKREVAAHFNCSDVKYFPLELKNGLSSEEYFWEATFMGFDFMTAQVS